MIGDALISFAKWLLDLFLWVPRKLWAELLDAFAELIEQMPVPDFIANAGNAFGSIPANVLYFIQFTAIGEGIALILSALVLRFILRRIPFIGG